MPDHLGLPQQRSSSESAEPALQAVLRWRCPQLYTTWSACFVCKVYLEMQCPVVVQSEQISPAHHLACCRPCQHGKTRSSGSSQPAPVGDHL